MLLATRATIGIKTSQKTLTLVVAFVVSLVYVSTKKEMLTINNLNIISISIHRTFKDPLIAIKLI